MLPTRTTASTSKLQQTSNSGCLAKTWPQDQDSLAGKHRTREDRMRNMQERRGGKTWFLVQISHTWAVNVPFTQRRESQPSRQPEPKESRWRHGGEGGQIAGKQKTAVPRWSHSVGFLLWLFWSQRSLGKRHQWRRAAAEQES
jgi:hypothetical protein